MTHLRPALALIVLFTILTGLALPLGLSGGATAVLPGLANGSLIERDGAVIGSALIGQNFAKPEYLHPRPSATTEADPNDSSKTVPVPYAADNSAASNLGPSSKALIDRVTADVKTLGVAPVPADAATTSASGLDPDISPENALRQAARIAATRGVPEERVRAIIEAQVQGRTFGVFGERRVNVLAANLALDAAFGRYSTVSR